MEVDDFDLEMEMALEMEEMMTTRESRGRGRGIPNRRFKLPPPTLENTSSSVSVSGSSVDTQSCHSLSSVQDSESAGRSSRSSHTSSSLTDTYSKAMWSRREGRTSASTATEVESTTPSHTDAETEGEKSERIAKKVEVKVGEVKEEEVESANEKESTNDTEEERLLKPPVSLHRVYVKIPPIEYERDDVLTPNDVKFQREQLFGIGSEIEKDEEEEEVCYTPKVNVEIGVVDQRYMVVPSEKITRTELPIDHRIPICILFIDSNDVIHCRFYEDDYQDLTPARQKKKELRIRTFRRLIKDLNAMYDMSKNQKRLCYNPDEGHVPIKDEVVVVKLFRRFLKNPKGPDFNLMKEYQRAKVLSVEHYGAVVELLDDYGRGLIPFERMFRISRLYAELPIQRFTCELDMHPFLRSVKPVHKMIRRFPIRRTWKDYSLNRAILIFNGKYSEKNLPLVDIRVRLITTPSFMLSLSGHVLDKLKNCTTAVDHLIDRKDNPALCTVVRADDGGNLMVQFKEDEKTLALLENTMENEDFILAYDDFCDNSPMKSEDVINSGNEKKELIGYPEKIYIVRLPKSLETPNEEMLFRVRISGYFNTQGSNKFRVYCMDYGFERNALVHQLVPLSRLCPDLCYFPPLAFEVHLSRIKTLDVEDESVEDALFDREFRIALVEQWPGELMAPEVNLEDADVDADVSCSTTKELTGLAEVFVAKNQATELTMEALTETFEAISHYLSYKRDEEEEYTNYMLQYGEGCIFDGDNFQFHDEGIERD